MSSFTDLSENYPQEINILTPQMLSGQEMSDNDYVIDEKTLQKKFKKKKYIKPYTSPTFKKLDGIIMSTKIYIVNAETGIISNDRMGSQDEKNYFKVAFNDNDPKNSYDPSFLFYDTPEQYVKHRNCSINKDAYTIWYDARPHLIPQFFF